MTKLFLNLQISRSDIRPHIKWVVSLVIAYGHFNLSQGFVWIYMVQLTLFITHEVDFILIDKATTIIQYSKFILFMSGISTWNFLTQCETADFNKYVMHITKINIPIDDHYTTTNGQISDHMTQCYNGKHKYQI